MTTRKEAYKVPTIIESLRAFIQEKKMTFSEAAAELSNANLIYNSMDIQEVAHKLGINSMCADCSKCGRSCGGSFAKVWSGCAMKEAST